MKKQSLLILFVSILFLGVSVTSCKKSNDTKKQEEEQNDDNNDPTLSTYLQGSDYYLITLDETSKTNIASRVKQDYRTDDVTRHLYIWPGDPGTYLPGTSSGPNAFGEIEGWTSLVVSNIGWSGFGFQNDETFDFTGLTDDHVLHFAMKSTDTRSHQIILYDKNANGGTGATAKFTIGAAGNDIDGINPQNNLTINGVANQSNFTRDGEWHHIEIPLATIKAQGIRYTSAITNDNMLAILSGGVEGTTLDIDGIFFYKPKK